MKFERQANITCSSFKCTVKFKRRANITYTSFKFTLKFERQSNITYSSFKFPLKFERQANITYSSFKFLLTFERPVGITCVWDKEGFFLLLFFLLHRCGNLWWVIMWVWRWHLREMTGKQIQILRYMSTSCPVLHPTPGQ